ncbi:MAG: tetratricopeptide repeat protein [Acidobacteria bacterium]|nr:tetratricopeptide repeat protein [Acidobacteriota bacterium]
MRNAPAWLLAAFLALPSVTSAQAGAPTREPSAPTADQESVLREGIELHDKGEFDQAIAKYNEVLAKSPGNVTALFELAYSYLAKRDFAQSFATAQKGAEYTSDLLPMFYDLMASSLDGEGKPEQAIEMYRKGLALAPDAAQLYFNMAVTYRESLNRPDEARAALEHAAALDPMHPGAHLLLGQLLQSSGYPTPAFLALSTFLLLDPGGAQGLQGYGLWRAVLKGPVAAVPDYVGPDAGMRTNRPTASQKTDQGDFGAFESQLPASYTAFMRKLDGGTPEIQALVAQVDQLLATLPKTQAGTTAPSFVTRHYVPFFVALKQQNFVEPFVYWASQRAPVPGVVDWLQANEPRVRAFLGWAAQYEWPKP